MRTYVQIKPEDNVAIAVHELPKGTEIMPGVVTLSDIPQAHKIALTDIPQDSPVIRYGVVLGYAIDPIAKGQWINEHMLRLPTPPSLDNMPWGVNIRTDLPEPPQKTWWGYRNPEGGYAGTRNLLGIQTTVQCVEGTLNVAVERIRSELLPKYPNVDGVVAINHPYGCGVAINAPEAKVPIRALRNIAHHPNFGGQLMVVSLGCEKLTVDMLVGPENNTPENVVVLQESAIQFDGEDTYVYLRTDLGDERRDVKTGISDGINIEIKSGLAEGDKVRGAQIADFKKK